MRHIHVQKSASSLVKGTKEIADRPDISLDIFFLKAVALSSAHLSFMYALFAAPLSSPFTSVQCQNSFITRNTEHKLRMWHRRSY